MVKNAVFGVLLPSLSAKLWQGSTLPAGLGLRNIWSRQGFVHTSSNAVEESAHMP